MSTTLSAGGALCFVPLHYTVITRPEVRGCHDVEAASRLKTSVCLPLAVTPPSTKHRRGRDLDGKVQCCPVVFRVAGG